MHIPLLDKFEKFQPFTQTEAWNLFRIAAFGEAIGWTLLIVGILIKHFYTPGNDAPVLIAGQLHGTLFIIYIIAVIFLYSTFKWPRWKMVIAGFASIPPYGSLLIEQWEARRRKQARQRNWREVRAYVAIYKNKDEILLMQTKESPYWTLPGGVINADESTKAGLERLVIEQTGIKPVLTDILVFAEHNGKPQTAIDVVYGVQNATDFKTLLLQKHIQTITTLDDIGFTKPTMDLDVRPSYISKLDNPRSSLKPSNVLKHIKY